MRFGFNVATDQLGILDAGQVRHHGGMRDELILLAAPAQAVADHLDLLEHAGLKATAVDAEPVALFRVFERVVSNETDRRKTFVLVGIDDDNTRVIVGCGGRIVLVKNIDIGGRQFTNAVATRLNLSRHDAHQVRMRNLSHGGEGSSTRVPSMDLVWSLRDAIRSEVEALADEIKLCLEYCTSAFRDIRPRSVTLTGEQTRDNVLIELLGESLGLEATIAQPLQGIDVSTAGTDFATAYRAAPAEWTLCAGLAVRGANRETEIREDDCEQRRLSA